MENQHGGLKFPNPNKKILFETLHSKNRWVYYHKKLF